VAATVYRREQGPRQFVRKFDSEDSEERSEKRHFRDTLARGEGPVLSTELHDRELGPCKWLQRGLGVSLHASRYLGKNTGIIKWEFASLWPFTFRIYIVYIGCMLYLPSLVDRIGT
jgi:hypothetical protein